MNIAVVGSGKVGKALGAWLSKAGFSLAFSSRTKEHAQEAARDAGGKATFGPLAELVHNSQIVLLTLPYKDVIKTLTEVKSDLNGRTVVDVTNPVSEDRSTLVVGHTDSGAEHIARAFPSVNVVKAFNAVFAEVYQSRNPRMQDHAISICYAGDNPGAKSEVRGLIEALGFNPVDAGPLVNSRCLEPLSLLNIQLGRFLGYGTEIGFSLLRRH